MGAGKLLAVSLPTTTCAYNLLPKVGRNRYYVTINLPRWGCARDQRILDRFFVVVRKGLAAMRGRGILENFTVQVAGVAQSAEHRFCKPRVESSSLSASSVIRFVGKVSTKFLLAR